MSYTPTTWQTGDTITAEKLNNMESGITQTLVVHAYFDDSWALVSVDYTPDEVFTAITSGKNVNVIFVKKDSYGYVITALKAKLAHYEIDSSSQMVFFAETRTDYGDLPPLLTVDNSDWFSTSYNKKYMNTSYEMGYSYQDVSYDLMAGYVFGFNAGDIMPYWRSVNERLAFGNLLDPFIAGAMQAAQLSGGKATITTAVTGEDAESAVLALKGGFYSLQGGFKVVEISGAYYHGAIALTSRMHTDNGSDQFVDLQTGSFQIPVVTGTAGAYTIDTVYDFTLSIYTKKELVSDDFVYSANLVLTAEEISPTSV